MLYKKDNFRFRVSRWKVGSSYAFSNDVEVILKGKHLWKYERTERLGREEEMSTTDVERLVDGGQLGTRKTVDWEEMCDVDTQKEDLASALFISTVAGCKGMIQGICCPAESWSMLEVIFKGIYSADNDASMSKLQGIRLGKEKTSIEYPSSIVEFFCQLDIAGLGFPEIERKKLLIRGLLAHFKG